MQQHESLRADQDLYHQRLANVTAALERTALRVINDEAIAALQRDSSSAKLIPLRIKEIIDASMETEKEQYVEHLLDKVRAKDVQLQHSARERETLIAQIQQREEYENRALRAVEKERQSAQANGRQVRVFRRALKGLVNRLHSSDSLNVRRLEIAYALESILSSCEGSGDNNDEGEDLQVSNASGFGNDSFGVGRGTYYGEFRFSSDEDYRKLKKKFQKAEREQLREIELLRAAESKQMALISKLQSKLGEYRWKCDRLEMMLSRSKSHVGGKAGSTVEGKKKANVMSDSEYETKLQNLRHEIELKSYEEARQMYDTLSKDSEKRESELQAVISQHEAMIGKLQAQLEATEGVMNESKSVNVEQMERIIEEKDAWKEAYDKEVSELKQRIVNMKEKYTSDIAGLRAIIASKESSLKEAQEQKSESNPEEFEKVLQSFKQFGATVFNSFEQGLSTRIHNLEMSIAKAQHAVSYVLERGIVMKLKQQTDEIERLEETVNQRDFEIESLRSSLEALQIESDEKINVVQKEVDSYQAQCNVLSEKLKEFAHQQKKFREHMKDTINISSGGDKLPEFIPSDSLAGPDSFIAKGEEAGFKELIDTLKTFINQSVHESSTSREFGHFPDGNESGALVTSFIEEELGHLRSLNGSLRVENENLMNVIDNLNNQKVMISKELRKMRRSLRGSETLKENELILAMENASRDTPDNEGMSTGTTSAPSLDEPK
eukprot:Nk52_evm22s249 gene=Nk52_evmTU22s249